MRISLHGGNCCGVKHIHDLGYYPSIPLAARKAIKMTSFGQIPGVGTNDMMYRNSRGKCDFFNEAAPQESAKERFNRFVEFIKKNRPKGIIEVILNGMQNAWIPILKEHGFEKVSSGKNSNTYSTIFIYHLVYQEGE
jgi:hypothetical protein